MEKEIRINEKIIKRRKPDDFAVQKILKYLGAAYEYKVAGEWVNGQPNQKPEEKRIVFKDTERLRVGLDVYFAWQYISQMKAYDPVFPEKTIQRLLNARQDTFMPSMATVDRPSLTLFVPWGVRPKGEFGDPEIAVMEKIKQLKMTLRKRGMTNTEALIMPADLYATEINRQVDNETATRYFNEVAYQARISGFPVLPWSEIRQRNILIYQKKSAELTNEKVINILGVNIIKEALEAAERRSGYDSQEDIEKAAFAYLRERICEAEIIETALGRYNVIKVSAVGKNKDNGVDRELPRIYILPPELQFPWLK